MSPSVVISVDAMGGDRGPGPIITGMAHVLERDPRLRFIVHGDEKVLAPLIARRTRLRERCELRHAPQTVEMSERPSRALRDARNSSMWLALETVARGEAPVAVSSGNTGALMAMAIFVLRKAPGIDRPAIAVTWPSRAPHGYNIVLDMGADVRADARNLIQYAVMGAEYARLSFGLERPRVGLINVGKEESKGTPEVREAAGLIRAAENGRFSYIGFVEGNDLVGDVADVLVTDGFTGNVALKAAEGAASFIRDALRDAFRHSFWSRIGSLFAVTSLRRMRARIDPRRMNGGVFLGLNGAVVKSHGGADAVGFASALELAAKIAETDFPRRVARQLAELEVASAVSAMAAERKNGAG